MPSVHAPMTLRQRSVGSRQGGANALAVTALVVDLVALLLLVTSFGILSLPAGAIAIALADRARRRADADAAMHGRRVAALSWWVSLVVVVLSLVALVVLAFDLTGAGGPGEAVEEAR